MRPSDPALEMRGTCSAQYYGCALRVPCCGLLCQFWPRRYFIAGVHPCKSEERGARIQLIHTHSEHYMYCSKKFQGRTRLRRELSLRLQELHLCFSHTSLKLIVLTFDSKAGRHGKGRSYWQIRQFTNALKVWTSFN